MVRTVRSGSNLEIIDQQIPRTSFSGLAGDHFCINIQQLKFLANFKKTGINFRQLNIHWTSSSIMKASSLFLVANRNSSTAVCHWVGQSVTQFSTTLWHHFHFVHHMVRFNSVHYLKCFQYGWILLQCKTEEGKWLDFSVKNNQKTLLFDYSISN